MLAGDGERDERDSNERRSRKMARSRRVRIVLRETKFRDGTTVARY